MNNVLLRWGIPALVTVVAGTAAALATTGGSIATDLDTRATQALGADFGWADVAFDGRDALVTGTAGDPRAVDDVVARLAAVHGVRSVSSGVVLAEHVSPYPFSARLAGGELALSGGVPDETAHAELLLSTGAARDDLRLLAGAPPRSDWKAAVDYALAWLPHFEEGEVGLADLTLTVSGRAATPGDFEALLRLQRDSAPAGVELGFVEIVPPLRAPYEWRASFDGSTVAVSGYAPDEAFIERLRTADLQGLPLSTSLVLASGAPEEFDTTATTLLQNLVQLESGTARISGTAAVLEGTPGDRETADRVRALLAQAGADVTLDPPRVTSYYFTATRSGGGIVLDGLVPDQVSRERLQELPGVDASGLELARGAPTRFASAVEFGLDALGHLSEGRFSIRDNVLALHGRARTLADLAAAETIVALGAPQGLILARAELRPPLASPYTWTAVKEADGGVRISGSVPSDETRKSLETAAGGAAEDASTLADGAPADFEAQARAGLALLPLLAGGSVEFDGRDWSLAGTVETAEKALLVQQAFAEAELDAAGWRYDVQQPPPPSPAEPYAFTAGKAADGAVTVDGFAPTEAFRKVLAVRIGAGLTDDTEVVGGQPDGFITAALAGIDALLLLQEGTLTLADGAWSLTGRAATAPGRAAAEQAIAEIAEGDGWHLEIVAEEVPPPAEPAIEVAVAAEPELEPESEPEPQPERPDFSGPLLFDAVREPGQPISLSGTVPADATRRFFGVLAGGVSTDGLTVDDGLPDDFIANANAGIRALASLADGRLGFDGSHWMLQGRAATEEARNAALASLEAAPSADSWRSDLGLVPPMELCRQKIASFAARNAILFRSGSATLTDSSLPALDELASYLALCPEAAVHVEGHTDADGEEIPNLALSVARAEAVVAELIARGVGFERLYAVGYGESLPVADNSTSAGKQSNRRIAFTIVEGHQ